MLIGVGKFNRKRIVALFIFLPEKIILIFELDRNVVASLYLFVFHAKRSPLGIPHTALAFS